ncbi:MAG TPA: glutamate--tRNA ligase [Gaiellales bacterium]|nr:glutamate--tRNA ligase [Gaiellales bacterium]
MSDPICVRLPPSPTGLLHVGSARTFVDNWLYARGRGGRVVLRFEDTDRERSTDGAIEQALRVLGWLGIDWDEGPFRQTERFDLYADAVAGLIAADHAYPCYCTTEELAAERARREAAGLPLIYGGRCASLTPAERAAFDAEGHPHAVRLRVPATGTTAIEDLIRGRVEWENALLGDHVIVRSDGAPTYQFANPFDDIRMGVTHVARGEDLLASTPRQLALYDALDAPWPTYAHLPMVLGPDRKRLSKRHGANSVEEWRDLGIVPDALVNYLALVGWSWDDRTDFMTRRELVERFDLARVNPSPAVFDAEKLEWLNGEHLRTLDPAQFAAAALDHLRHSGSPLADQPARVAEVAPLVQEKLRLLSQFEGLTGFLFGPVQMRPEAWQKVAADTGASAASLAAARDALAGLRDWRAAEIEAALRAACERTGLKPRVLYAPVRVAISGSSVSPGLYESLELLGRESSLERIESAIVRLS